MQTPPPTGLRAKTPDVPEGHASKRDSIDTSRRTVTASVATAVRLQWSTRAVTLKIWQDGGASAATATSSPRTWGVRTSIAACDCAEPEAAAALCRRRAEAGAAFVPVSRRGGGHVPAEPRRQPL